MRERSLRWRIALAVGATSAVVLAGIGLVLVTVVDRRMHDSARNEALRALSKAKVDVLAGGSEQAVTEVEPGQPVVELFSRPLDGASPEGDVVELASLVQPGDTIVRRVVADGNPREVAVTTFDGPTGRVTMFAAAPLGETEATISTLRTATALAVPAVSVLLAGLAFLLVDRALRPVHEMQAEADLISHGTLHRRLTPTAESPELADLACTINEMLDRLERAASSQRRFASDASHELRSPLTTLRTTLELAQREPDGSPDAAERAIAEVDRLERLVADLLTLSRLDEAGPTFAELDLDDVVRADTARIADGRLRIDTSSVDHARLDGDLTALTGLVRNLLDNAVHHARSRVRVALRVDRSTATLTVEDDGPGVPAAERERIFERFARLDEARDRHLGGSGLGLAVAAAAVRTHAGSIVVDDSPAFGGARFTVELPTSRDVADLAEAPESGSGASSTDG